jgi:hypothetical protein
LTYTETRQDQRAWRVAMQYSWCQWVDGYRLSPDADTTIISQQTEYTKIGSGMPRFENIVISHNTAGLVGGGCLTAAMVVIGASAFVLYYLLSGQPAKVSQIVPRFAYWLPFALLGLIAEDEI